MVTVFIILIVISAFINMIADIYLVSGKESGMRKKDMFSIIEKTPVKHINLSGMIGVFALSFWMLVLYFLSFIEGTMGTIALVSFAMYIGSIMVFHVACSHLFLLVKRSDMDNDYLKKILVFYMIPCVIFSLLYTGVMIYLGLSGVLKMNILYYLTLPFCSTCIFQFGLGNIGIIKWKHFESIIGTLSMLLAMLGTIGIIVSNYNVM